MKRTRTAIGTTALVGLLALAVAAPAAAGDVAAPRGSVIGDWQTRAAGFKQTVTFDEEGNVYGNAGCNQFKGDYRVRKGALEIGPLATTLKYCEGRMDAEQDFLTAIQSSTRYRATDTVLTLKSPDASLRLKAA